ncbi:RloB family protein [Neisseria sicca]|uniref:RloB family protein n=1 Tax=Neisseria sicca TaxID=490 RepID=UPI00360E2CEA
MGSEDLFKKRKAKRLSDYQRKKAYRQPYERILIVCEGEKTEPFYFKSLCASLSLHTANVEITGNCGSSPKSIFKKAQEMFKEAEKEQNPFDKVYCVFDKDCHHGYNDVVQQISSKKPKNTFFAITSVPCFEYWLLLHFERTTSPFKTAEEVISKLKQFIPNYEKGDKNIFEDVKQSIQVALHNAKHVNEEACKNHTDNPSTCVLVLVDKLLNLKN